MATMRRQRQQAPDPSEYSIIPGDRDTEYVEVGHAYPLPIEMVANTSDASLSTEQFLGLMLAELVRIREAVEDLAATT